MYEVLKKNHILKRKFSCPFAMYFDHTPYIPLHSSVECFWKPIPKSVLIISPPWAVPWITSFGGPAKNTLWMQSDYIGLKENFVGNMGNCYWLDAFFFFLMPLFFVLLLLFFFELANNQMQFLKTCFWPFYQHICFWKLEEKLNLDQQSQRVLIWPFLYFCFSLSLAFNSCRFLMHGKWRPRLIMLHRWKML